MQTPMPPGDPGPHATDTAAEAETGFDDPQEAAAESAEIEALLRRLPGRSSVRQIAEEWLQGEHERLRMRAAVLDTLLGPVLDPSPRRWQERKAAAWTLGNLPWDAQDRQTAAEVLDEVLDDRLPPDTGRVWRGLGRSFLHLFLGVLLIVVILGSGLWGESLRYALGEGLFLALSTIVGIAGPLVLLFLLLVPNRTFARLFAADDLRVDRVRATAATALGRLRAVESVGTLAAAMLDNSALVRKAAKPALHAVLTALTADHYGALTSQTVPNLCRTLGHPDDAHVLAVLEALGKVGDGRAVSYVARLAAGRRSSRVRSAAEQLLPILRERQVQERAPDRLLRPAESPDRTPEALIRPADLSLNPARYEQIVLPPEEEVNRGRSGSAGAGE